MQAVPRSKTTATNLTNNFLDHWPLPYGILTSLFTDDETMFVRRLFETTRALLEVRYLTITLYYLQTSGRAERFIITSLPVVDIT